MDRQMNMEKLVMISRRRFLFLVGWGSLVAILVSITAAVAKFFYPKVLYEPDRAFQVGFPEDFPPGRMVFYPQEKVFVVREPQGFHAISAVCTHLGCTVEWDELMGVFGCPCHGSRFHRDGHNYAGPAPRPLDSFALFVDAGGRLIVDRGKILRRSGGGKGGFKGYFRVTG
jgi:cytochrome b6-f complex iron-sulfur subunit